MSDLFGTLLVGIGLGQIMGSDGSGHKVLFGSIVCLLGLFFMMIDMFKGKVESKEEKK